MAFQPDRSDGGFGPNAMLVNRSTNGGVSWGLPTTLIVDTNGQVLNDKNSLTANSTNPSYAYAVWDRLRDFTLPEALAPAEVGEAGSVKAAIATARGGADGVVITRERVRAKARAATAEAADTSEAAAPAAEVEVSFEGPTYLARTINGGASWRPARKIYDPGPNAQTIGNLIVVPPNGNVIDFFTDILPNGTPRLALLRSLDEGATWEQRPTIVTTMGFSLTGTITPDLQEAVRDAAILFDVAVDRTSGRLYLVWQDTRFHGIDQVAFSQSSDNGATWSTPVVGGHFLGDYMGLVTAGRVVHPVFGIATGLDRTTEFTRRIVLD